ncbi:MAG: NAD-dependent epimerase/dehydratase family protein [Gemmatimonadales bacterium]
MTDQSRREFVQLSAMGALGLGLGGFDFRPRPTAPLDLLILGGTGFIGPHQVEYARSRGHRVTIFNRGKTAPELFPNVETLIGDRDGKLDALRGRKWDAVIDNSGYVPRHVRDSAQLLKDNVGQYLFISTGGVYAAFYNSQWPEGGVSEDSPREKLAEPGSEEVSKYYGPLKALCEDEVTAAFPRTATILRPGLIVGPGDPTDRFTYWVVRPAQGGEMVAPGTPNDPILYIDARDLGVFCVHLLETKTAGTYNVFGPRGTLTMGELLDEALDATGRKATLKWVDGAVLEEHKVHPYGLFPWVWPGGSAAGGSHFQRERAFRAGMTFRPVRQTVKDTLEWFRSEPAERQAKLRGGLPPEKEREILAAVR